MRYCNKFLAKIWLVALLFSVVIQLSAHAATTQLSLLQTTSFASYDNSNGRNYSRGPGLGIGTLFSYQSDRLPVYPEIGLFYFQRVFSEQYQTSMARVSMNVLEIPLLLRLKVFREFSVGFGTYYRHGLGNPSIEAKGGSYSTEYRSPGESSNPWNYNQVETGGIIAVGTGIPTWHKKIFARADFRYEHPLASRSSSDFLFLLGITFLDVFSSAAEPPAKANASTE